MEFISFLWISANSGPIPPDSAGMTEFLQESVGHGKVLDDDKGDDVGSAPESSDMEYDSWEWKRGR